MKNSTKHGVRLAALGAASAVVLAGALGAPAMADETSEAPVSGAAYAANAQELLLGDEAVQAVATDGDGNVVVYATEAAAELEDRSQQFIDDHSNVVLTLLDGPLEAYADTDVVGGAGYAGVTDGDDTLGLCSVGFAGWTPSGEDAVITAGHCTDDGAREAATLSVPAGDPAGGGNSDNSDIAPLHALGTFGFSQFGGPGNTEGSQSTNSVDIAVIDVTNGDLSLLPEVTDWTNTADLAASTTVIKKVGTAVDGQPIAKSGRTTGYTTAPAVEASGGWANISGRLVYGFAAVGLESDHGDSGGALIQGDTAVGVLSGGGTVNGQPFTWGADLQAGLALTGGYTVKLDLDEPVVSSPANGAEVGAGSAITGTGPAGLTLVVTPEAGAASEVAIDGSGNWSFNAPSELGAYAFSLRVEDDGFNVSDTVEHALTVVPAAPVIADPADGSTVETSVSEISGTADANAEVTVSGDVEGTVTADADGNWSVEAELGYGSYLVEAVQVVEGLTSPVASSAFSVAPVAPVITTPEPGAKFEAGQATITVAGTGIDGASVSVDVEGATAADAVQALAAVEVVVEDGAWSVELAADALAAGAQRIVATQAISGVSSAPASVEVEVVAAPVPPAPGPAPEQPSTPAQLAETGAEVLAPGIAALALLLGAGVLLLVARRRTASE